MSVPVVCFIPCCKAKKDTGKTVSPCFRPDAVLEETFRRLERARQDMISCVETASKKTSALYLYSGHFYSVEGLVDAAENLLRSGRMRLFIISAGYGLLDAFEPCHTYEAVMSGRTARYWRDAGLTEIIAETCLLNWSRIRFTAFSQVRPVGQVRAQNTVISLPPEYSRH